LKSALNDEQIRLRAVATRNRRRLQARDALAQDPTQGDLFESLPKNSKPRPQEVRLPLLAPIHEGERTEYVVTIGEAAARLGVTTSHLEAMIDGGTNKALRGEFIRAIPTREIARLLDGSPASGKRRSPQRDRL
jgi:hypothetical protein